MSTGVQTDARQAAAELKLALGYFALYLAYLCWHLEGEALHWASLVGLPMLGVHFCRRMRRVKGGWPATAASVGLQWGRLSSGVSGAILIGMALCLLQFVMSRQGRFMLELLTSTQALYALPLAFLLLLFTAAFTEEFFFRGVLQTRLTVRLGSSVWATAVTSAMFGLYHLPYAYLHPGWPSHGDVWAALAASMGQGFPIGLVLGYVYARSRSNLIAAVLCHALVNTFPAMVHVARWLG